MQFLLVLLVAAAAFALGTTCKSGEYCDAQAERCLLPTNVSCVKKNFTCPGAAVCSPITKLCSHPGAACKSTCADNNAICDPAVLHCLTVASPGGSDKASAADRSAIVGLRFLTHSLVQTLPLLRPVPGPSQRSL